MQPRLNLTRLITTLFLLNLLIFFSCKKENSQDGSSAQQEEQASMTSSESDGEAELVYNEVFDDVMGVNDDVGMAGTGVFGRNASTNSTADLQRLTGCFTVSITHPANTFFPVKVVIDFGTGCSGVDQHVRKGKIISEYTNRLVVPGAIATTTFDGFYIDSIKVEGTHKITNSSSVGTSQLSRQFTVEVIDAKLSKANGNYTEWNSKKVISQIEGLITQFYPRDDVFQIEGSSHGKVKRGSLLVAWESNITEPLIKKFACPWIVKGKIKTNRINTSNSTWVAVLDFGGGDCDNKAIITINGTAHNITLH